MAPSRGTIAGPKVDPVAASTRPDTAVAVPAGRRPLTRYLGSGLLALVSVLLIAWGLHSIAWQIWAEVHYRAAERALEQQNLPQALTQLALCLRVRPHSAELHFLIARTARRAGDYEQAEQHLKESERLGELPQRLELERRLLLAQRGEVAAVEKELEQSLQQNHPEAVFIAEALAQGYLKSYQLPRALACLQYWLQREPDNVQALWWRGDTYERSHRFADALADYRRVVELAPERAEARLKLAEGLVQVQRPEEALPHFEYVVGEQPENAAAVRGLAHCRHLAGEPEEARRLLEKLLSRAPDDARALGELGRLELEAGHAEAAERRLRRAWALAPYDRETVYALSLCLERLHRSAEAKEFRTRLQEIDAQLARLKELTRQIASAPHDAALRYEAGMIFVRSGQVAEGLRWIQSALQEDPSYEPARKALEQYQNDPSRTNLPQKAQ